MHKIVAKILLTLSKESGNMLTHSNVMRTYRNIQKQAQATSWLRRSGLFCSYLSTAVTRPGMLIENPDTTACRQFAM